MGTRTIATVVLVAFGALFSSCSNNGPTAPTSNPSDNSQSSPSTSSVGKLQITAMALNDAGQSALGDWLYDAKVNLLETGGVDVTVTNLQVQASTDSKVLATASTTPMLSMRANSRGDTALVFAGNTHVQVSAVTADVTVQFRDAKGNTGSVSCSFSGFGYWDY
jgi:hypothetical protein